MELDLTWIHGALLNSLYAVNYEHLLVMPLFVVISSRHCSFCSVAAKAVSAQMPQLQLQAPDLAT